VKVGTNVQALLSQVAGNVGPPLSHPNLSIGSHVGSHNRSCRQARNLLNPQPDIEIIAYPAVNAILEEGPKEAIMKLFILFYFFSWKDSGIWRGVVG